MFVYARRFQEKDLLPDTMVSAIRKRVHTGDKKGFTLLELLVTVVLVAMVTLVVTIALKLAIGAWERGAKEGDKSLLSVSIPRLLERQLESIIKNERSSTGGEDGRFPFCGNEHTLSFFSSFAPMGSSLQGLLRITYTYDPDDETLLLYEQVITSPEDLKDAFNPFSENWYGELKPVSKIEGISAFDLMYSGQKIRDTEDEDQWKKEWRCNSPAYPSEIRFTFSPGNGKRKRTSLWYFHVGQQSGL